MTSCFDFPDTWAHSTIGDHVRFEGGTQPPRSTFVFEEREGYIRLVQTRDFKTDKYKTFIPATANHKTFTETDIMIGRYGPPVFQIYRGLKGAYNVALIKASPKTEAIDSDYLFYTLRQDKLFTLIDSLSRRSSGQTGIDMDALKSFPLSLPPINAQRAIVSILRTWDEAIDSHDSLADRLEKLNSALTHKLVFGSSRLAPYASSRTKKKHRWFILPSDWRCEPIGRLAREVSERNREDEGAVMLSCSKYDGFVRSLEYFKKQVFSSDLTGYKRIHRGDFGFPSNHVEEGSIGLQNLTDIGLVSPIYTVFRFSANKIDNEYAHYVLKTWLYRHIFEVSTSASVDRRGSLRWDEFATIPFPVPSLQEQREIVKVLHLSAKRLAALREERSLLERQKRGLMQKLLTGEWRVNDERGAL
jgi:type I restriction enzyme, S subunit